MIDTRTLKVETRVEVEPAVEAYQRHTVTVEVGHINPFTLGNLRAIVEAFVAAGVPDDAYCQTASPIAYASWRRPV